MKLPYCKLTLLISSYAGILTFQQIRREPEPTFMVTPARLFIVGAHPAVCCAVRSTLVSAEHRSLAKPRRSSIMKLVL